MGYRKESVKIANFEDMDVEVDPCTQVELEKQERGRYRKGRNWNQPFDGFEQVSPQERNRRQDSVAKCLEYIADNVLKQLDDPIGFRVTIPIYDCDHLKITMRLSKEKISVWHTIVRVDDASRPPQGGLVKKFSGNEDMFFTYVYTIPREINGEQVGGFRVKTWISPNKQCEMFNIFLMSWSEIKAKVDSIRNNLTYALSDEFDPANPASGTTDVSLSNTQW